ncbi:hypothetical protein [Rathayibacter rathayi]|nr:hypothetical protein [Rathayibacter rathayi]MWV74099.1 hypothetical protein [Rathayibacter rathayi NCPPB 2980 = VKM Ac-1601]PPF51186.1 hypothetical protein C5C08_03650 [Rathayibacter rathayi]PPG80588.1 hypothetical protein C5C15_02740 [Rathayibacter rathayi]PPI04433.1 hypothetical protein C5C43_02685 [Rathayibacter rathayi]TWD69921.1 hypothetical protein FB469_1683 [Rathayibacter rathayi]
MAVIDETALVSTDGEGLPIALEWRGSSYRVTDRPTVWTCTSAWWAPLQDFRPTFGRPPVSIGGWRFQATDLTTGGAFVLDVVASTEPQWSVVRVYE